MSELLRHITKKVSLQKGVIYPAEFVVQVADELACANTASLEEASEIANLIPSDVKSLVLQRINCALAMGYMRSPWHIGGPGPGEEGLRQMTIEATENERSWAALLKPLLEERASQ